MGEQITTPHLNGVHKNGTGGDGEHVLVTGATGFIGRELVTRLLGRGHHVRALVRSPKRGDFLPPQVEQRHGDLREPETLASLTEGIDTVFHLGAAVSGDWPAHRAATVEATAALLEDALQSRVKRFIHVSSIAAVDTRWLRDGESMTERTALVDDRVDLGPYARGKAQAERLVLDACKRGLNATIARPGLVYGAGRVLFEHFGCNVGKGLLALGNERQRIGMVSLDSLVQALLSLAASDTAPGRTYIVVDGAVERRHYLGLLGELAGRPIKCRHIPIRPVALAARLLQAARRLPGGRRVPALSPIKLRERAKDLAYDTSELISDTDWRPSNTLRNNLARAVDADPAALYPHRKLRVGIIGAGVNAAAHLKPLTAMRGIQVVGIMDLAADRAAELAGRFGLSCHFDDADVFYGLARPDVVHIVTPPNTHCPLAVEALGRGVHVLCEKPMAMSVDECEQMQAAAIKHGRTLGVHNPMHDPVFAKARAIVGSGAIGKVVHVDTTFGFDVSRLAPGTPEYEQRFAWLSALPGGVLEDLAPHALHATMAFAGSDLELAFADVRHDHERDEPWCRETRMALRNGATTANVNLSLSMHPETFTINVYGTKSSLHIDAKSMLMCRNRLGPGPRSAARAMMVAQSSVAGLAQLAGNAVMLASGRLQPPGDMRELFEAFYSGLARGDGSAADAALGKRVVEIVRSVWPMPAPSDRQRALQRIAKQTAPA